jgi:hypothetical protein
MFRSRGQHTGTDGGLGGLVVTRKGGEIVTIIVLSQ